MIGSSDMKGATAEAQKLRKEFIEAQTTELVDPINVVKVIADLDEEVSSFLTAVDAALSTSNATTEITVEY
jgi:division protein CdvB (Snf7/Vps24/ESCRT-III family)